MENTLFHPSFMEFLRAPTTHPLGRNVRRLPRLSQLKSEANGRVVRRKGFAKTIATNFVEGPGHTWNPGLFAGVSWNGGPVGKTNHNNKKT